VMGGGLPAAAFGGRADVMAMLAPLGAVYQAGTLAGNPIAAAAGATTLRMLDDTVYATVDRTSVEVSNAVSAALSGAGVAHRVQKAGSLFSVFFSDSSVTDYASAQTQEAFRYKAFFHSMLSQGVYLPPSAFEAWFISAAHHDDAISQVLDALPAAAAAAASATPETS
jgi:glutamate-1-semialdehyde 2,1-aminomutase